MRSTTLLLILAFLATPTTADARDVAAESVSRAQEDAASGDRQRRSADESPERRMPDDDAVQGELIEEAVELRRRLEQIEERLTPESRRRLEERLRELEDASAAAPEDAASTAPPDPVSPPTAASPTHIVETDGTPLDRAAPAAARVRCNTLRPFDTSGDGILTGADRYWRYLKLWLDADGDGRPAPNEWIHPFELGIVEIELDLRRFHNEDGSDGEIEREDGRLRFFPLGKHGDSGVLGVETTRIRRGDGLDFRAPDGEPLEGIQELRPGLEIVPSSGDPVTINCP
jgi:hypothetical protein